MEKLTQHIEYLLQIHDCVIVPGIGAFITIYKAPAFDKSTGMISAPSKEIRFNPALKSDDGMLANSIARKERISYREGSEMMTKAIAELGQTILHEGEATIGKLGVIKREEEGNIRFYPFKDSERCARDLGMIAVPIHGVSENNTSKKENECLENNALVVEYSLEESQSELKEYESNNDFERFNRMNFEKNFYIPINKIFAKACACLIAVAIFALIWVKPSLYNANLEDRASVVPIDKMIDSAIGNSEAKKPMKKDKKISNSNLFKSNENPNNLKKN